MGKVFSQEKEQKTTAGIPPSMDVSQDRFLCDQCDYKATQNTQAQHT